MIILASSSPRRKELLKRIIPSFKIIPSDIDETQYSIDQLAYIKGEAIAKEYPQDLIISADTYVHYKNLIFNKPLDEVDAKRMLLFLSNKTHSVTTNFAIICKEKNITYLNSVTSKVTFNNLSEELVDNYIKSKSPLDKAGAYGIQDNDRFPIIKNYTGSLENIIGLPIDEIAEELQNLGIKISTK